MVGSHEAGAETWKPLIDESVARMLGRACTDVRTVSFTESDGQPVRNVCSRKSPTSSMLRFSTPTKQTFRTG